MRKVFDPTLAMATTVHPLRHLTFQGPLITANFFPLQEEEWSHRPRLPGKSRTKPSGLSLGEPETYKSLNGIIKGQALSFLNPPKGLGKCCQAKLLPGTKEPPSASAVLLRSWPHPRQTPLGLGPPHLLTLQPVITMTSGIGGIRQLRKTSKGTGRCSGWTQPHE